MLITFSGLDGSGKTTLIGDTRRLFEARGRTVTVCSMYDDVTLYAFARWLRDRLWAALGFGGHAPAATAAGPQGAAQPAAPRGLARLAYAVVRHPLTRACVLPLDVVVFACRNQYERHLRRRVLIMDRYFYDSLADLAGEGRVPWLYIAGVLRFLPRPRASIFVDVDAETAYVRKREYEPEYMRWRRTVYQRIFAVVPGAVVIENYDRAATGRKLEQLVDHCLDDHAASRGLMTWNGSGTKR